MGSKALAPKVPLTPGSVITAGSAGAKYTGISHPVSKPSESLAAFHAARLAEHCIMTLLK